MHKTTELKDNMNAIVTVLGPLKERIKSNRKFVEKLLHIFSSVHDFRNPLKIKYKLENLLCICLLIAMHGRFTSFSYVALFTEANADYFRKLGLIEGKNIPSHDTFRRLFMCLDADELRDSLQRRIHEFIRKITDRMPDGNGKMRLISGDGKTFNGSGRKNGKRNINVLNVFDASSQVCLSSIPLDDKESEIPAFQSVLRKMNLRNTMVTADALHCQRKTMEIITERGGLFTVTVKDNQPGLKQHVIDMLGINEKKCEYAQFDDRDFQILRIDWKPTEEDFPETKAFICMVSHKRKDQADYNPQPQYFISSSDNPQLIMEAICNRWDIEGGFHWLKDDLFNEDECVFMAKHAIKVMAIFNNISYSLFRISSALFHDRVMGLTRARYEERPEEMLARLIPLLEGQNLTNLIKENMRGARKKK